MVTKSDKQRVLEALARYEARFDQAMNQGKPADVFAAAVDWLRAECKLINRYLDDEDDGWGDNYLCEAAMIIGGFAVKVAEEIRGDLK